MNLFICKKKHCTSLNCLTLLYIGPFIASGSSIVAVCRVCAGLRAKTQSEKKKQTRTNKQTIECYGFDVFTAIIRLALSRPTSQLIYRHPPPSSPQPKIIIVIIIIVQCTDNEWWWQVHRRRTTAVCHVLIHLISFNRRNDNKPTIDWRQTKFSSVVEWRVACVALDDDSCAGPANKKSTAKKKPNEQNEMIVFIESRTIAYNETEIPPNRPIAVAICESRRARARALTSYLLAYSFLFCTYLGVRNSRVSIALSVVQRR